jgi:PDZ domain-containing secreted protein
MMKSVSVCKVILVVALLAFVFIPLGCSISQPGETAAEGHRRHQRVVRINQQELMADIDKALLTDKPSKLTDKRIP